MRNRKTALLCGATLAFILPGMALAQTPPTEARHRIRPTRRRAAPKLTTPRRRWTMSS